MVLRPIHPPVPVATGIGPSDLHSPSINSDSHDRLSYAQSLQRQGHTQEALTIYSELSNGIQDHRESGTLDAIGQRAQENIHVIFGIGGFTPSRAEYLAENFMTQIMDPASLGAMVGAGLTFQIVRFGLLGSAARCGMGGPWVRNAANLLAFSAEASTFPIHTRWMANALGRQVDWSTPTLINDVQSSFLVLGGLRLAGGAGRSLSSLYPRSSQSMATYRFAVENASMFTGLLLGHQMEQVLGLTPHQGTWQILAESLITFTHFKGAQHLIPHLTGRGLQQLEQNLRSQNRFLEGQVDPTMRLRGLQNFSPPEIRSPWALAMALPGRSRHDTRADASLFGQDLQRPHLVFSMGGGGPKNSDLRTPELIPLIQELNPQGSHHRSDLLETFADQFHRKLHELRDSNADRTEVNLQLAEILRADWIQRMVEVGVQVSQRPMEDFFREHLSNQEMPHWIRNMFQDPDFCAMKITEIFADAQAHANAESGRHAETLSSFAFDSGIMDAIAMRLELPSGSFLKVTSVEPQEFRRYLPPVEFFLKIPEWIYGGSALEYQLTPNLSSAQEVAQLLAQNRRPWIVTDRFVSLHEYDRAHPYTAWTHDIFHILDLSGIPTETRKALPNIFNYFSELPTTGDAEAHIRQELLPYLLEGEYFRDGSHAPLLNKIKYSPTSREFRDRVLRDIEEIIALPISKEF